MTGRLPREVATVRPMDCGAKSSPSQQGARAVDDQTEYSDEAPAVKRPRADRTYVARLDFMTQMHLLRLDGATPAVMVDPFGEERIRVGTMSVPVLETITEALRLLVAARESAPERRRTDDLP